MKEFIAQRFVEIILGGITLLGTCMYKRLEKKVMEQESIKMGVQALLRDRIIQSFNHYMDKGEFPIYARENIEMLYKEYRNLGGNGVVTHLMEKLHELPTELPKETQSQEMEVENGQT